MAKRRYKLDEKNIAGYLFSAPLIIGVLAFSVYPMISAFILSLQKSQLGMAGDWVGFSNYEYVFADTAFWKSLYNTLYMGVISVAMGIAISFTLASLINVLTSEMLKNFYKSVYFLPNVISVVATTMMFTFLFFPSEQGILNYFLGLVNIEPIGWFTDPKYARFSIVLMSLWGAVGYNTIIFLAGLQSVPRELYEAAEVDGATGIKRWRYITIPYLRPFFLFMVIMGTIGSMKRFADVWLIGGIAGNPNGTLMTSILYIYRTAFLSNQMGIATAASYLLFFVILILTLLMLLSNRQKHSLD